MTVCKCSSARELATPSIWASRLAAKHNRRPLGAEPLKEPGLEDWLWYVEKALYRARESSKAFQGKVKNVFDEWGWRMLNTVPCLAYNA